MVAGINKRTVAFQFIVLMGIVSLLGDIVYEGARGVTGPYLAILGASAAIVGLIGGLGEFIGYALRLLSGFIADRTKAYWILTFIGYGLLLAVPLLAFARLWWIAAFFIILERMGKAVRSPARDALLSTATKEVGRGLGFGVHEALDQIGAIIGPLIFSLVFWLGGDYHLGFSILWIPALLVLGVLAIARIRVPSPERLETSEESMVEAREGDRTRVFVLYSLFTFLSVAGFVNFLLISYHFKLHAIMRDAQIPAFFALAMGIDAGTALVIGRAYDTRGLETLLAAPLLSIALPFLAFSRSPIQIVMGVILWGAVMGIHETIMRAAVADLTPVERRGSAYGIFNTIYGLAWLFGGAIMGFLYDISLRYLLLFAVLFELSSIPIFLMVKKAQNYTSVGVQ
ncbi:MAG: MFS transporter [Methanophagales archaeon ANME-1-THS]|nr:MAG: MFS transporter [Methanophagales archaeon ANME-1-THS]